jgi:hypothetical protein
VSLWALFLRESLDQGVEFSHVTLLAAQGRACLCVCVFFSFSPFELLAGDPVPVRSRPLKSGYEPSLRYQAGVGQG